MATRVPATDPPPFAVADGVRCIPVGELATVDHPGAGYVIIGGGKTALDAIGWLLDRDTDPDTITWIRPRDSWLLNRAFFQPGRPRTFEGVVLQLEAMVASRVGGGGVRAPGSQRGGRPHRPVGRADHDEGRDRSLRELEQLRRVEHVVRLGHVERIEPDGSSSSTARCPPRPIISMCIARRRD